LLKAADADVGEEKEGEKEKGDPVKPITSTVFGNTKEKVDEEKVEVKKEEKEDGEIAKDTTIEPVKSMAEESKKASEIAAAKSPTPEAVTPKNPTNAVTGLDSDKEPLAAKAEEEKPGKGLFTSKIPVSVFPSVSTPSVFGNISDKGTATPKIKVKEEVVSPDSTPKAPVSVFSPPPMDAPSSEHESGKGKGKAVEKQESSVTVSDTSFGNLSLLSEASSFVEVEDEGQGVEVSSSDSDTDGDHGDDLVIGDESSDGSSFLSDSYASSDESPEEEPESDEEEDTHSPEPTAIPLPASRSPSATPQPELPAIHVTPSPSDSPEPGMLPTIPEEESTTPPGTPTKEQPPLRTSPSPAPISTPPLFGVGLGRPSTRPTRSSPLANTPVSLEDNEEQEVLVPTPQVVASPKPHFAILPMPPPSPDKPEAEESSKTSVSKPPLRPRTPPLLLFGSTKPSTTPATPAPRPSMLPPKAASAPPAAPPFGSLFGKSASPPVFGVLQNANNQVQAAPAKSSAPSPSPSLPSKSIFPPPITPVATPSFGIFGTPPQGTTPPPQPTPTPAWTGFSLGSFSLKGSSATPAPPAPKSLFGSPLPSAPKPATPAPPAAPSAAGTPAPHPVASMEEGMQKECAVLFLTLNKELEDVGYCLCWNIS
jgi:nucleoporin NUP159